MIVKNGAETIRPCLESAQRIVSQIVIADTGCTDNTCDIVREFGATVVSYPWQHHFANARNAVLAHMTTDWVLVLDADEEIDRDAKNRIPELMLASEIGGYVTPILNYMPRRFNRGWDRMSVANDGSRHERAKDAPSYIAHENCRFFRRHPGIYFTGRVHELVEKQVLAAGFKLGTANFVIHHFGQLMDHDALTRKRAFYRDLMRRKTEDNPDDVAAWVQLGLHEFECFNQSEEALRCFEKALALQPNSHEAWLFKGMVYVSLGRWQDALDAIDRDPRTGSSRALREDLRGDALLGLGRLRDARLAYRRALQSNKGDPMLEGKLGFVEVKLNQKAHGLRLLRRAARAAPQMYQIQDRLMKACIMTDNLAEAAEASERCIEGVPHPKMYLRAASIHAQARQWDRAEGVLSRGMRAFPQAQELVNAYSEVIARKAIDASAQNVALGAAAR